ncbi:hypothetical protein AGOR_G00247630 [Albula goreensis]|uniref:Uncharacterized protein n=1 Tax=Albula goreensis TaxID=1534307 RepID=A0A8T3CFQ8_9TELE|nr:hypothetical protein AGOR_G00247630 [Albula goreensis]
MSADLSFSILQSQHLKDHGGGGRNRTCSQGQDTVSLICLDCRGCCRALSCPGRLGQLWAEPVLRRVTPSARMHCTCKRLTA